MSHNIRDPELVAFVAWLWPKSEQQDDVGAVARHVHAWAHVPDVALDQHPQTDVDPGRLRWDDFEGLKISIRHYAPDATIAQFDAALAAFQKTNAQAAA
jgi:predicted nucleotidyltransferase